MTDRWGLARGIPRLCTQFGEVFDIHGQPAGRAVAVREKAVEVGVVDAAALALKQGLALFIQARAASRGPAAPTPAAAAAATATQLCAHGLVDAVLLSRAEDLRSNWEFAE